MIDFRRGLNVLYVHHIIQDSNRPTYSRYFGGLNRSGIGMFARRSMQVWKA